MRIAYKWAIAPPVAGLFALACCFAADNPSRDRPPTAADRDLIVHEWGTFSTFSGSDGKNLKFYPYDSDLPEFVYGYQKHAKAGPEGGLISLETPVLYFYSDHPLTASVQVEFPQGTMTEWYPHAIRTDKKLSWKGIKVLPGEKMKLPTEEKKSRYYAARETDATPLRVSLYSKEEGQLTTEQEKFLFYRGVGDFDLPLTVRAQGGGKFSVSWDCKAPQPQDDLILVQIDGGKCRFQPFRLTDKGKADVQVPDADSATDKLGETMVALLTERGLTEKEARAMVKTWSSAWFGEEGTRVLYLLPEETTDKLLPLTIDPKPATLVRVLVGRHDVLTPEKEKQIEGWVAKATREGESDAGRQAASEALAKLGRYRDAAWTEAEARLQKKKR